MGKKDHIDTFEEKFKFGFKAFLNASLDNCDPEESGEGNSEEENEPKVGKI